MSLIDETPATPEELKKIEEVLAHLQEKMIGESFRQEAYKLAVIAESVVSLYKAYMLRGVFHKTFESELKEKGLEFIEQYNRCCLKSHYK
jgi:hypothetical protein